MVSGIYGLKRNTTMAAFIVADVAASSDLTGPASPAGSRLLEIKESLFEAFVEHG
jgi:hypothetical protein